MRRAVVACVLVAGCGRVAFDPLDDAGTATVPCGSEVTLVACYAFERTTNDSSGHANHATGALDYASGHRGMAGLFGAGVDVRIADSPSIDAVRITVMGWLRLDELASVDERSVIVDRNVGFALFVRANGYAGFGVSTSASGGANASEMFPLGVFTHVAATYDGTMARLYIGGIEVAGAPVSGDITTGDTAGSRIGGNVPDTMTAAAQVWEGAIDELGLWSQALPAARIADAATR